MLATHAIMLMGDYIVGMVVPALQVPVLVILARRKLLREFFFFTCYGVYSIVASVARLWTITNPVLFFPLYCWTDIGYGVLELLAIYEVAKSALHICYRFTRWTGPLPYFVVSGLILIPAWRAVYHPIGRGPFVRLAAGAYAFQWAGLLVEALIFLLCLRLANLKYYPINFGRQRFSVLLGFGFAAGSSFLACMARYRFWHGFDEYYRYIVPAFYTAAAGTWIAAFWSHEPPDKTPVPTLEEIERHNQRLDQDTLDLREARKKLRRLRRLFDITKPCHPSSSS